MIRFFVAGRPQQQGSARAFIPKGWTRAIITSDNKDLKSWRQLVSLVAQDHRPESLWTGGVSMRLRFDMPKPKSLPKRTIPAYTKFPDLDKLVRSVGDSLSGIIFRDDAQVCRLEAEKVYSDSPGVMVELEEVSPMVVAAVRETEVQSPMLFGG